MGGHAFKEIVNSKIPKHLLDINVRHALMRLGLEKVRYSVVGNVNKEEMGDVDIAIDEMSLAVQWGIPQDKIWDTLPDKLVSLCFRSDHYKIIKGWRQFHLCLPLMDKTFNHSWAFKNGLLEDWGIEGYIQVDIMVGNVPWMEKVLGPADSTSKWKALYRTNLITDLANLHRVERGFGVYSRLFMDHKAGLFCDHHVVKEPCGLQRVPQDNTISRRLVTTNPDELARLLFGPFCTWNDVNSYENVLDLMNDCVNKDLRIKAFNKFKTRLEKEKLPVPDSILSSIG